MSRYEITTEQWERVKDLSPQPHKGKGRPAKDNRIILNGMMWIARSGAQWRELPEKYGPWQTVYSNIANGQMKECWKMYLKYFPKMLTWRTCV